MRLVNLKEKMGIPLNQVCKIAITDFITRQEIKEKEEKK